MKKTKGLSIIAITLLLLQMFSVNLGMGNISQASNQNDHVKVQVKHKSTGGDTLTWDVDVKVSGELDNDTIVEIMFSSGQSHRSIDHDKDLKVMKETNGYTATIPGEATGEYSFEVKTEINNEEQDTFSLEADVTGNGPKVSSSDQVKIERSEPEQTDENETTVEEEAAEANETEEEDALEEVGDTGDAKENEESESEGSSEGDSEGENNAGGETEGPVSEEERNINDPDANGNDSDGEEESFREYDRMPNPDPNNEGEESEGESSGSNENEEGETEGGENEVRDEDPKEPGMDDENGGESEEDLVEEEQDEEEDGELDETTESEMIEPENYGEVTQAAVKAFETNRFGMMGRRSGGVTAIHDITAQSSENICLRNVDGEINFFVPATELKKPVDIVVVQDASGSYEGSENQVRQSLRDIANMLDFSQDRMMVTSYRGYSGWRSYNNLAAYNNGTVRAQYNRGSDHPQLTLRNHTNGLSNNKESINNAINNITFGGATPTASGLQFALNSYTNATAGQDLSNRKTIFILLTDGVANAQLDGNIHIQHNTAGSRGSHQWAEGHQFYQPTFNQVNAQANQIKAKGYTLVSAYWENLSILQDAYGTNYYNNTVGPAARQLVTNVASSPELASTNANLAELINEMLLDLQTAFHEYDGFQAEFEIAAGFELVEDSVKLNGSQVSYVVTGNQVTITKNKIPSGNNSITYQLREVSVHSDTTTPVTGGLIQYDSENGDFNQMIIIPEAELVGNESALHCQSIVNKGIAKSDSTVFTNEIQLDQRHDIFKYRLEYQFNENIGQHDHVQLKDKLESVLQVVGDASTINILAPGISSFNPTLQLLDNQSGFTIDLPKVNNSYQYLAGKNIVVTFSAKIRDGVTTAQLQEYSEERIPNVAQLILDEERVTSDEVFVQPPPILSGKIKLIKVDAADESIKLAGAIFAIKDSDGNVIELLETEANGEDLSGNLPVGTYTLEEIQAPTGYSLTAGQDLSVTITANETIEMEVENSRIQGSVTITKIDGKNHELILPGAFFVLKDADDNVIETKQTGVDGRIVFANLSVGTYTIEETQAPAGYRLLPNPIHIEITYENPHKTITVENDRKGWEIPQTGGIGSFGLYGVGFIIIAGVAWYVIRRRRVE